jgi:hypothetical protein
MKKFLFLLAVALIGLTAYGQRQMIEYGAPKNVVAQKVQIDSIPYSQDSVPTFYWKNIRTIQDTTGQMRSTMAELKKAIQFNQDVLKANTKSINARYLYVKDSIKNPDAQQSQLQEIQQMDARNREVASQLDMLKKTKNAFEARLLLGK